MSDNVFVIGIIAFVFSIMFGLIVWAGLGITNDIEAGPIVEKYYDDEDVVCSKGCTTHEECFALVIDTEPWYDNRVCVSESYYNTVEVGDTFKGE